ncbi:UTRA domain-containing protein [Streptodolium elevatio]
MTGDDAWIGDAQPYLAPRPAGERDAWTAEAAARGRRGGQRLLAVETVTPPPDVEAFFASSHPVILRRRLILLDDKPVELANSYYPARIAQGTRLAERGKIPGGAVTLLSQLGYIPEDDPIEDVGASVASAEECQLLELSDNMPVLVLTRFTRSTEGVPVEVSIMTGTRHLQYRQQRAV